MQGEREGNWFLPSTGAPEVGKGWSEGKGWRDDERAELTGYDFASISFLGSMYI